MNLDNQNDGMQQDGAGADELGGAGAADLTSALAGGGDAQYVVDQRKSLGTGTFIMIGLVLACAGGTYLMYHRSNAKVAAAAPEQQQAEQTISQFLSPGNKDNVKQMRDLLDGTQKVVDQFMAETGRRQVPVDQLATNPFRLSALKPAVASEEVSAATAARLRAEQERKVLEAAEALNLQTIMRGRRKACMINNTMFTEGQQVDGFTIEAINPQSVILVKGEYRVERKMQQ